MWGGSWGISAQSSKWHYCFCVFPLHCLPPLLVLVFEQGCSVFVLGQTGCGPIRCVYCHTKCCCRSPPKRRKCIHANVTKTYLIKQCQMIFCQIVGLVNIWMQFLWLAIHPGGTGLFIYLFFFKSSMSVYLYQLDFFLKATSNFFSNYVMLYIFKYVFVDIFIVCSCIPRFHLHHQLCRNI